MPSSSAPAILCVGIAVQDIVFRVAQFPPDVLAATAAILKW